jgi:long-chain fatty acid transport protein
MKHKVSLLAMCLAGHQLLAGGYQVALQGQRQIGMGHTGTALAYDASSIFFNPGGLVFTKMNNITMGGSFIRSRVKYLAPQETNAPSNYTAMTESPMGTPFTFYASWGPKDSDLKFGLGAYTPYGSSVKWADNWKGYSVLQELKLQSIFIQPTVSYKIGKLGIGAGLVYAIGSVNLRRGIGSLASSSGYSQAELDGSATGMGFNAGLHYEASEKLTIGLAYRSKVEMKVDGGDATFTVPSSATGTLGLFPATGKTTFDATLPLPANLSVGLGYKVSDKLTLALDYNYVFWSAYKELKFDYADNVNGSKTTVSPRNYQDASIIRVGAEYMATEKLAVRAGYYYDQSPVKDGYMTPETPDANRNCFTLGLGYRFSDKFSADASFLFIEGTEREQTQADVTAAGTQDDVLPGTYKLRVLVPGISLSYKF